MSDELHRRVTVTLRTLTIVATLAIGVAFGFFVKGVVDRPGERLQVARAGRCFLPVPAGRR